MPDELPPYDRNAADVYAAVGFALTQWEWMEHELGRLYSVFKGKPYDLDTIEDYGGSAGGDIFKNRLIKLGKAAKPFFDRRHDQQHFEYNKIIEDIEAIAQRRHQIAHGVVTLVPTMEEMPDRPGWHGMVPTFCLMPPRYSRIRLQKSDPRVYDYNSAALIEFGRTFIGLRERIAAYSNALSPAP